MSITTTTLKHLPIANKFNRAIVQSKPKTVLKYMTDEPATRLISAIAIYRLAYGTEEFKLHVYNEWWQRRVKRGGSGVAAEGEKGRKAGSRQSVRVGP